MAYKLIFSKELETKFDNISFETKRIWDSIGISDSTEMVQRIVLKISELYPKVFISSFEFRDKVEVFEQSSNYFGIIEDEEDNALAYVFVIPPKYETRSGVLAQQVFPVMSGITPKLISSNDNRITNKPIFILNVNEVNQTAAMALNIVSGKILDFRYIDVFDRNIEEILMENGFNPNVQTLKDYDTLVTNINKNKKNEIFEVDYINKSIRFLILRLKDGIHVNNEPYWFVLKAYAALYLARREQYKCDMTLFDTLARGNKTLDAFRDFVHKICK